MANKTRKDKKGYTLRTGECQRKDGRYSYSYTDRWKKRHTVYATSLVELRELEKQIRMDIDSGINPNAAKTMTLNDMFDLYISRKYDLKPTTKSNYQFNYDHFIRDGFGKEKIGKIRYSDVKKFYYDLMKERGIKPRTLDGVNNALHRIVKLHNEEEEKKAKAEKREPILLPQFSAHQLRHTFCTRFCENETNLKVIQSIMGHSDITTTMDIYADATQEKKQEIMANLNGKIF